MTAVLAVPIGVASAIYLEEYGRRNFVARVIEINITNLAAVPSIIYGLWGILFFAPILLLMVLVSMHRSMGIRLDSGQGQSGFLSFHETYLTVWTVQWLAILGLMALDTTPSTPITRAKSAADTSPPSPTLPPSRGKGGSLIRPMLRAR